MSRAIKGTGYNEAVKELHDLGVGLNVVKEGWSRGNIRMYSATIRLFDLFYPGAACLLPQGVMRSVNLLKLHKEVE